MVGFADIMQPLYFLAVRKVLSNQKSVIIFVLMTSMVFCTLYLFFVSGKNITLVMVGLFILRLNMQTMAVIPYHINQLVFPIECRGIASGVMNFGGRSIGALAMIVCEYTE